MVDIRLATLSQIFNSPAGYDGAMYPWRGEFTLGDVKGPVAIATLASHIDFPKDKVAIWGHIKTENLGIEKVIVNVISNPELRVLIVCGEEVRGHRSGHSLFSIHKNGIDENGRIIGARGAVPFIENVPLEAIERFQEQVELVDMIGNTDVQDIIAEAEKWIAKVPGSFGEPFIVNIIEQPSGQKMTGLSGKISLHKDLLLDPYLEIEEMPAEVGNATAVTDDLPAETGE